MVQKLVYKNINDYLLGLMDAKEKRVFEAFLDKNYEIRTVVDNLKQTIAEMDPSEIQPYLNKSLHRIIEEVKLRTQDKIDSYLMFQMDQKESELFEHTMKENIDLFRRVEIQKIIKREIEKEAFLNIIHSKNSSTKVHLFTGRIIAVAAILIGVVFIIWQPHKSSNSKIFNTYAYVQPDLFYTLPGIQQENTRGDILYGGLNSQEIDEVKTAMDLFDAQQYAEAALLFEKILTPIDKNYDLALYMAVSELLSGKDNLALNNLILLSNLPSTYKFANQAKYYLALAYIHSNNLKEARIILNELSNSESINSKSAEEILSKLRWF